MLGDTPAERRAPFVEVCWGESVVIGIVEMAQNAALSGQLVLELGRVGQARNGDAI